MSDAPTIPAKPRRTPILVFAGALALLGGGVVLGFALDRGGHAPTTAISSHDDHAGGGGLDAVAFIDRMVPHHEMAVEMSQSLLARSKDAELRKVAQEIITMQRREIEQMSEWRRRWTGKGPQPLELSGDELAAMGMTHRVDLDASPNVDADYLDAMLPHHAGGLVMAERALQADEQRAEVATLARRIITNQGREIGVMQGMRQNIATFGTAVPKATGGSADVSPATPQLP